MNGAQLKMILGRPIAFHRALADVTGNALTGLFLSQAVYWSTRTEDRDGWFWKTQDEWTAETAMTRREVDTARKTLRSTGVIAEKRQGQPCKTWFRVDFEKLADVLAEYTDRQSGGNVQTGLAENAIQFGGNVQASNITTKTTPKTTPKTTRESLVLPEGSRLESPDFRAAWSDWEVFRREIGKTLKPSTVKAQLAKLEAFGPARAVAAIRQSIEHGWTGLFEPRNGERKGAQPKTAYTKDTLPEGLKTI